MLNDHFEWLESVTKGCKMLSKQVAKVKEI